MYYVRIRRIRRDYVTRGYYLIFFRVRERILRITHRGSENLTFFFFTPPPSAAAAAARHRRAPGQKGKQRAKANVCSPGRGSERTKKPLKNQLNYGKLLNIFRRPRRPLSPPVAPWN